MICFPGFDSCGVADASGQHFCSSEDTGHYLHVCECGQEWIRDTELELAQLLYLSYYTNRYLEELHAPSWAVVIAATKPKDSPWRRMAREAVAYMERSDR